MSERNFSDYIGEDVEVEVYFDFEEEQELTRDQEFWPAKATINSICVGGNKDKDVLGDLNSAAIERLEESCFEHMAELD